MLEAVLNLSIPLIEIILWTVFIVGIVRSDKEHPCDGDCDHCPFPKCDKEEGDRNDFHHR